MKTCRHLDRPRLQVVYGYSKRRLCEKCLLLWERTRRNWRRRAAARCRVRCTGVRVPDATRAKMSEAAKRRWARTREEMKNA